MTCFTIHLFTTVISLRVKQSFILLGIDHEDTTLQYKSDEVVTSQETNCQPTKLLSSMTHFIRMKALDMLVGCLTLLLTTYKSCLQGRIAN